jgi:hypothetical protein
MVDLVLKDASGAGHAARSVRAYRDSPDRNADTMSRRT